MATGQPVHAAAAPGDTAVFEAVSAHDFDGDPEFQAGLNRILASGHSSADTAELVLQAKCFFVARKFSLPPIDAAAYKDWLSSSAPPPAASSERPSEARAPATAAASDAAPALPPPPADGSSPEHGAAVGNGADGAPYPASFAEICELIMNNKPIPGIKEIPNILNTETPQPSTKPPRRKPWEAAAAAQGPGCGVAEAEKEENEKEDEEQGGGRAKE